MKVNYHTHTPHCRHAIGNSTSEYASAAYQAGIEILGFSDHAPFKDHDFGYRMLFNELDTYLGEVDELTKEYSSRMTILKSLEIEYLPEYAQKENYYEWLLNKKKLDYLLLGEHFFRTDEGELLNIYEVPSVACILDYAKACCKAMDTGYFSILAHPDLFGVNEFAWGSVQNEASEMIIESAIKNNVILEFNANGYRRGVHSYVDGDRYMYPLVPFWDKVKEKKPKVIVSSDTHNPKEIWDDALDRSYSYLDSLGITPIKTFLSI